MFRCSCLKFLLEKMMLIYTNYNHKSPTQQPVTLIITLSIHFTVSGFKFPKKKIF